MNFRKFAKLLLEHDNVNKQVRMTRVIDVYETPDWAHIKQAIIDGHNFEHKYDYPGPYRLTGSPDRYTVKPNQVEAFFVNDIRLDEAPLTQAPNYNSKYYWCNRYGERINSRWDDCSIDRKRLENLMVFTTPKGAETHYNTQQANQGFRKVNA